MQLGKTLGLKMVLISFQDNGSTNSIDIYKDLTLSNDFSAHMVSSAHQVNMLNNLRKMSENLQHQLLSKSPSLKEMILEYYYGNHRKVYGDHVPINAGDLHELGDVEVNNHGET